MTPESFRLRITRVSLEEMKFAWDARETLFPPAVFLKETLPLALRFFVRAVLLVVRQSLPSGVV